MLFIDNDVEKNGLKSNLGGIRENWNVCVLNVNRYLNFYCIYIVFLKGKGVLDNYYLYL